jgi:hypothetical protein
MKTAKHIMVELVFKEVTALPGSPFTSCACNRKFLSCVPECVIVTKEVKT